MKSYRRHISCLLILSYFCVSVELNLTTNPNFGLHRFIDSYMKDWCRLKAPWEYYLDDGTIDWLGIQVKFIHQ